MRSKPKDYAKGTLEYAVTLNGKGGNIGTLLDLWKRADISEKTDEPYLLVSNHQHPHIYWSINQAEQIEFDIYNTARVSRYNKVRPNKTNTRVYRKAIGEFVLLLVQAGYTVLSYQNEELKNVRFGKTVDAK